MQSAVSSMFHPRDSQSFQQNARKLMKMETLIIHQKPHKTLCLTLQKSFHSYNSVTTFPDSVHVVDIFLSNWFSAAYSSQYGSPKKIFT